MSDYNIRAVITAVDRGFSSVLGQAQTSLNKFGENAASSTKSASDKVNTLNSSFKSIASAIGVMQLVSKAISVVGNSVGSAVKRVDTLANAQRVFQNMGFSAQQSSTMMEGLKASINGLPTALDDAVSGVQMLAASTGDLGKSQKVYSALNDSIIGFGGSTADVKNAVLQLSQAFANGKIDGMTWISMMNSQMGPVLTALAKKFGMTTGELQDALSSGKISVGEFQDALIELDSKGGGGLASLHQIALDATSGIGTSMENAKTAVTRGLAGIINAINTGLQAANLPTISQMIAQVGTAAENVLSKIAAAVPGVIGGLASLTGGLQPLQPLIKGVVVALAGLVGMILASSQINATIMLFKNLGTAIGALSNPITAVVVVIGLIVAAFVKAYNSSATFRNGINQVVQALSQVDFSGFSAAVQGVISTISGALKPAIDGIGTALGNINWSTVASMAQSAFQTVVNVITIVIGIVGQVIQAVANVAQGFMAVGGATGVLNLVKGIIMGIWTALTVMVTVVGNAVQAFLQFGNATGLFHALGAAIGIVAQVLGVMSPLIGVVAAGFTGLFAASGSIRAVSAAVMSIKSAISLVLGVVTGFGSKVVAAFNIVKTAVMSIGPAFSTVMRVATMMGSGVMRAFSLVRNGIMIAMNAFKAFTAIMMANPFVAIIAGITLLVTALVLFFTKTEMGRQMWQNFVTFLTSLWQGLVATAQAVWTAIGTALTTIWTTIVTTAQAIWQGLVTFFTGLWNGILAVATSVWNAITNAIQTAITVVSTVITTVLSTIQSVWSSSWNAVSSVASSVWDAIKSAVSSAINAVSSVISSVMNAISSTMSSIWNAVKSVTSSVWNGIKSAVQSAINAVSSVVTSVMNAVRSVVTSVWNAIRSAVSSAVNTISSVVSSGFNAVRLAVSSGMNGAVNAVRSAVSGMVGAGRDMISGLVNGIRSGMSWVVNAARNVARAAVNAAKAALHIGSPSKIMRDKIGKWIPAGVGVGIDRNLGWITNATDGMRQAAMFEVPSPDMSPLANGLNQVRAMTSQSIGTSLNSTIDHELSVTSQPAYINLSLGGSDYTTYVADISKEQGNQASLSRYRI